MIRLQLPSLEHARQAGEHALPKRLMALQVHVSVYPDDATGINQQFVNMLDLNVFNQDVNDAGKYQATS